MKESIRLLSTAIIIATLLFGCQEDPVLPTVAFTIDPVEITIYDEVAFSNTSTDADTYAWDFGDGATSTEMNPVHIYKTSGTYTATLVASNEDGTNEFTMSVEVNEPHNYYEIDGTEYVIDAELFWYVSPMGGDPYIRLITTVPGQDNPDLLKLYPNKGLGELPGTYTWDGEMPVSSYDLGYTANYAGMSYDWTAIGKTGSGDLVITELDPAIYLFEGDMILSVGTFDWGTGEFLEESTTNITLKYIGGITAL